MVKHTHWFDFGISSTDFELKIGRNSSQLNENDFLLALAVLPESDLNSVLVASSDSVSDPDPSVQP